MSKIQSFIKKYSDISNFSTSIFNFSISIFIIKLNEKSKTNVNYGKPPLD